eukprot:9055286-Pyramimonas_sp.AAC.1
MQRCNFAVTDPLHHGMCCMRTVEPQTDPYAVPHPRKIFTDANLDILCSSASNLHLESLSLAGSRITDAGVARICEGLRTLRELDLSQCVAVTDAITPKMMRDLRLLEV